MAFSKLNGGYIGSQVRITVSDGIYDGFLNAVDVNTTAKKLTLEKITSVKTGKKLNGLQHFFSCDIQKVEVIQDNRKKAERKKKDTEMLMTVPSGPFLITSKQTPGYIKKLRPLEMKKQCILAQEENKDSGPAIIQIKTLNDALKGRTEDQLSQQNWPEHYLLINKNDHLLNEAIIHIQKQTTIGLAVEGVKLGRQGRISFLQIATRSYVFVFDVLALGTTLFEEGLTEILKRPNIQKVMHDCRWVSDALFHQHGVKLINVFDTAVAEMVVYKNRHMGDVPRYVQSLSNLLMIYNDFNSNDVNWTKIREDTLQSDQKVWLMRPVCQRVLAVAVRHVMYLVQLRVAMLEAMLQDFQDGVDVFLGFVRDAPEDKLARYDQKRHLLPDMIHNSRTSEAKQYQRLYKNRYLDKSYNEDQRDSHGRRENCAGSLDSKIIFSTDSVWHLGNGTHIQGVSKTQAMQECNRRGEYFMGSGDPRALAYSTQIETNETKDDDRLISLGEEHQKKKLKKKEDKKREEQSAANMTSLISIPAGCAVSSVEFPARDVRIKDPNKRQILVGGMDICYDSIPSHSDLVKADPINHRPVPTAGKKAAWERSVSSTSSDSETLMDCGTSSKTSDTENRSASETRQCDLKDHTSQTIALTSGSCETEPTQTQCPKLVSGGLGLGRGMIKQLLLKAKEKSANSLLPTAKPSRGQFDNAD